MSVDKEELFVLWGDAAYGWMDGIPNEDTLLNPKNNDTERTHNVRKFSGKMYGVATYYLRINAKERYADLDYSGPLKPVNVAEGMDIGVMRLRFLKGRQPLVEWSDEGGRTPVQAAAIVMKKRHAKLFMSKMP